LFGMYSCVARIPLLTICISSSTCEGGRASSGTSGAGFVRARLP